MSVEFVKYEALGNDYVVLDPTRGPLDPSAEAIAAVCDRHFGVGADGVLLGPLPSPDGFGVRIFNSDGSEAEKSGNGLRIFARYVADAGHATSSSFALVPLAGPVRATLLDAGLIRVSMGHARVLGDLPRPVVVGGQELLIGAVDLGNPHCVLPVAPTERTAAYAQAIGPLLGAPSEIFPGGANVQLLTVADRSTIDIEIFERGAGYTLASGSSSCASAYVAHALGLVDGDITVRMPGGTLAVSIDPTGAIEQTGPVREVMRGTLAPWLGDLVGGG